MALIFANTYSPMKEYFHSIDRVFEETLTSKGKTDPWEKLRNTIIFVLVFSVIPLLPYVNYRLWRSHVFHVSTVAFSLQSLWMWWSLYVVLSTVVLVPVSKVASRRTKAKEKTWLSGPQLRFALCYGVVDEIEKYRTNRFPKHIEQAADYEERLWHSMVGWIRTSTRIAYLRMEEELNGRKALEGNFPLTSDFDVDYLIAKFKWFKLEPRTLKILDALRSYHFKVRWRIQDKKDLSDVSACLMPLAAYLYAQIPDLQSGTVRENNQPMSLEAWGDEQIDLFAAKVEQLSTYAPKPENAGKQQLKQTVESRIIRVSNLFSHPNIFLCFVSWLICLALLVWFGTWIMLHIVPGLKMDSVLVSMVIGTPVAGAATLVAIARHQQKK